MIMKTLEGECHCAYLEEILESDKRYNMNLNLVKCSFNIQEGKYMRFMLTKRGIEVNEEKFQSIINMRSPSNIKKVQPLTRWLATLALFFSYIGDKMFYFFDTLKRKEKFTWKNKYEEAFTKLKIFLAILPILKHLKVDAPLYLYMLATS